MTLNKKRIVIGADHRGYQLKERLKELLSVPRLSIEWVDVGAFDEQRSDYPEFAISAAKTLRKNKADVGVLICGTGIGMAVAANRFAGIYAALVWNVATARLAKEDDHANVLVLPSDFIDAQQAVKMVEAWLMAQCKKGRYEERVAMIDAIDGKK